jgi:hypothetical protein
MGQQGTLIFSTLITLGFSGTTADYIFLFLAVFAATTVLAGIVFYREKSSINLDYRGGKRKKKKTRSFG